MLPMIYKYVEQQEVGENVVSFTDPKYKEVKLDYGSPARIRAKGGFHKKSDLFTPQQETLQIKCVEDLLGWKLPMLRGFASELPFERRYINPNPLNWMSFSSNEVTLSHLQNFWLDTVFVLAQTMPEIAKRFFVPIDDFSGDEEFHKILKREVRQRIKKVNAKKLGKFQNRTMPPEQAAKVQGQLISNEFWTKIGQSLGVSYVRKYCMSFVEVEPLLIGHLISECAIPYFDNNHQGDSISEVGDLATVYGYLTLHCNQLGDHDWREFFESKEMTDYFSSNGLQNLELLMEAVPNGSVPTFNFDEGLSK